VAVLIAATVVRGGVLYVSGAKLRDDPDGYRRLARNVVTQGTYGWRVSDEGVVQPSAYRPPLYTLLVVACVGLPGGDPMLLAWLHLVIGVATVAIVLALARQLGLGRAGPVAALLVACDPILLNQSTLVMTETVATLLAVLAWALLVRAGPSWSIGRTGLAGGGLALAALCRPTFLVVLVAVAVAIGLLVPIRRRWPVVLAFATSAALVLTPWTLRNAVQFGRPIVATTHGGYTFWLGNNPSFYDYLRNAPWGAIWRGPPPRNVADLSESVKASSFAATLRGGGYVTPRDRLLLCQSLIMGFDVKVHGGENVADRSAILAFGSRSEPRRSGEATPIPKVDKALLPAAVAAVDWPERELALDRWHYAEALATIRAQPGMFAWSSLVRLGRLWQPAPHRVDAPKGSRRLWVRRAVGGWYLLEYALAAIGLWGLGRLLIRPPWLWGTLLCGGFSLVHLVYWSNMRMRSPLLPVVALLAAAGAARLVRWRG
jgi:4-amino-4-deoxy-L-arabinose transferase-like glycosyltransferase